jgi:uncharacterized protein (DUF1778 family)
LEQLHGNTKLYCSQYIFGLVLSQIHRRRNKVEEDTVKRGVGRPIKIIDPTQIQIRISRADKEIIRGMAAENGMNMSEYVVSQALAKGGAYDDRVKKMAKARKLSTEEFLEFLIALSWKNYRSQKNG